MSIRFRRILRKDKRPSLMAFSPKGILRAKSHSWRNKQWVSWCLCCDQRRSVHAGLCSFSRLVKDPITWKTWYADYLTYESRFNFVKVLTEDLFCQKKSNKPPNYFLNALSTSQQPWLVSWSLHFVYYLQLIFFSLCMLKNKCKAW